MEYLLVSVCPSFTDTDLREDEVIPGLEKPAEPGIDRALGESVRYEYRA
jgi:hypothetical protein